MKKLLIILCLLLGCIITLGCDNKQTSNPYSQSQYTSPEQSVKEQTPKEVTVYITYTGKKYHRITCRYLSKSCIPIELNSAKSRGYTPCSVCAPPIGLLPSQSDIRTAQKEIDSNPFRKYRELEQKPISVISKNDTKELLALEAVDCPKCNGKKYATCSYCQGNDLTKQTCSHCNGEDLTKQICSHCNGQDLTNQICSHCNGQDLTNQICSHCNGQDLTKQTCQHCNGLGKRFDGSRCYYCSGTGLKSRCYYCSGTGHKPRCYYCSGTGHKPRCYYCSGTGNKSRCYYCSGTGHKSKCYYCNGTSYKQCLTCLGEGLVFSLSNNTEKSKIPSIAENKSYYGELNENGIPKTVFVQGYYRKDGTYVSSYYRSPPTSNSGLSTENSSYYGEISDKTGRPKDVHVGGYYRKDGTYVKEHYRSKPSRRK